MAFDIQALVEASRCAECASPNQKQNAILYLLNGILESGGSGGGGLHNLLSLTHPDTVPGPPLRGSLIVGNATPDWEALLIGAAGTFLGSDGTDAAWTAFPGGFTGFANPTALVGLTPVNGIATTAMRSDAAPALDQGIVPTWTGAHTWTPPANTTPITVSAYSLTGANAQPLLDLSGTWNTSGTPSAIKLNITNTASGAQSLLLELQRDSITRFAIKRSGFAQFFRVEADTSQSGFEINKRGTTGDSTAALSSGSGIGTIDFLGWDGAAYGSAASVRSFTTEAWTGTNHGSSLVFATVAIGATALATRATLTSNSLALSSGVSLTVAAQNAVQISPFGAAAGNTGELRFLELAAGGTNYTGFKAADAMAASEIYVLPNAAPAANRFLQAAAVAGGVSALSWAQVSLTADVTGILPVANGGSGTSTAFTAGSVIFAGPSGVFAQDNANFFWDDTNNTLGVGTTRSGAISGINAMVRIKGVGATSASSSFEIIDSASAMKLCVIDNGNIGIGIVSPASKLSFTQGGINPYNLNSGGITLTNTAAGSTGNIASFSNAVSTDFGLFNVLRPGGAVDSGDFQFYVFGPTYSALGLFLPSSVVLAARSDFTAGIRLGASGGNVSLFSGGTGTVNVHLTVTTTGLVGIGRTAAVGSEKVVIEGALAMASGNAVNFWNPTNSNFSAIFCPTSGAMQFNSGGVAGAMYITSPGLVGIGETVPLAKLHVTNSAAATVATIIKAAAAQSANLMEWQDSSAVILSKFNSVGNLGVRMGATALTAYLHLAAGTTAASTAPLKFTTGTSMTTAEAGAVEFTTDNLFFTITTGVARKRLLMADATAGLTSGKIPIATTNGRLIDLTASAAYTPTNVTTDRAYDANATSVDELADVLGTVIADLQTKGILG